MERLSWVFEDFPPLFTAHSRRRKKHKQSTFLAALLCASYQSSPTIFMIFLTHCRSLLCTLLTCSQVRTYFFHSCSLSLVHLKIKFCIHFWTGCPRKLLQLKSWSKGILWVSQLSSKKLLTLFFLVGKQSANYVYQENLNGDIFVPGNFKHYHTHFSDWDIKMHKICRLPKVWPSSQ